jgi:hypothetical protein
MADGEYVHGSQNIEEQKETFALFWVLTKWSSVLIIVALALLAFTRTNAVDCSKSDIAAKHLNACGKLPSASESAAE